MAQEMSAAAPNKKQGFNLAVFVRDTRREIAKVTWPSRKETMLTTVMIVLMALVTGIFFFGIDSALGYIVGHILSMGS